MTDTISSTLSDRELAIELDGTVVQLRCDFNALGRLERRAKDQLQRGREQGLTLAETRALRSEIEDTVFTVWTFAAAFDEARDRDPRLSLKKVGSLVGPDNVTAVDEACEALLAAVMPQPEPTEEGVAATTPDPTPATGS